MTLSASQSEGIRGVRAEAYRVAALIEMDLEGLRPSHGTIFPKSALCAQGVALQGPVDAQDVRGVIAWAEGEQQRFHDDDHNALLTKLIEDADALLRLIEGRL